MGDSAQNDVRMRRSVIAEEAGDLIAYVFAAMAGAPAAGDSIWPYVAKGGPGAQLSMQCECKTCVDFGGGLFVRCRRRARRPTGSTDRRE